jgi:tetratricopeptide (TPR) repeat protein
VGRSTSPLLPRGDRSNPMADNNNGATHPDEVFNAARRLDDPTARAAYLCRACGGNAGLRRQVEALLSAFEQAGSFLLSPAAGMTDERLAMTAEGPEEPLREGPGTVIGRYKLLERIGEGGFGVVFMAEQQHPVRRKVALKVIKPGLDSRQVVARFEAERQALAIMDHPNIARVFDAGATDAGRPYFVMELVHGVPITEYCDKNQLPPRERLELFVQVCRAVQHAHTKGIVHRDIKPSNVLVTLHEGVPAPKVIDFGIAKATQSQLTEKTLFTNFAQMVGTPLYMSPEQAEMTGIDVDTRSDVYSLGVLLYELLTGTTPVDQDRLKQAAFDEVRRIIREEEPPRPSTRISTMGEQARRTISARRKSDPKRLGPLFRGELDWIVMKALEKDRARRYETANGFAADVQRYLDDEPVSARATSAAYRTAKFVRKHKVAALAAGAVAAALVLGVVGTSTGLVRARAAQAASERDKAKAVKLSAFLQSMLASARPASPGAERSVTLVDLLDRASAEVADKLKDEPEVEIQVRFALAQSYGSMGVWRKQYEALQRAYHLVVQTGAQDSEVGLRVAALVASPQWPFSRIEADVVLARQTLVRARREYGDDHEVTFDVKGILGRILKDAKPDEAETIFRELTAQARRMPPRNPPGFDAFNDLADLLNRRGKKPEAEDLLRENLARAKSWSDVPWSAIALSNLLIEQARPGDAMPVLERIIAESRGRARDLQFDFGPWRGEALREYHWHLTKLNRPEELRRLHRDQFAAMSHLAGLPATSSETLAGRAYFRTGVARFSDALDDFNKAIDLDPTNHYNWYLRGCLLAYLGGADPAPYALHREAMLGRFGEVVDGAEQTAKSCVLLPPSLDELHRCAALIDGAVATGNTELMPWFLLTKGMVEYRARHFKECVESCVESRNTMRKSSLTTVAAAELFLAMGHHGLDHAGEAREAFERARLIMETQVPKAGTEDISIGNLEDWLIAQVAYREAAALLDSGPATSGAATRPAVPAEQ